MRKVIPCPGCGAVLPDGDGPTHPYLGASPGCWASYGEVLAKEYGKYGYPPFHRLSVDAYAAQHPGTPSRRSIQSVAVHLISLYFVLERGLPSEKAMAAMRQALRHRHEFVWLAPPAMLGDKTILDVRDTTTLADHEQAVRQWAASVWQVWSPHQETVRRWAAI